MTGPNPDAELDEALGVTALPPTAVTELHRRAAYDAYLQLPDAMLDAANPREEHEAQDVIAQAIADAEQRGAARVIAEHEAAGT